MGKSNKNTFITLPYNLAMASTDMGGGWRGWSCGNSVLNLMHSTSTQLYWEDYSKGRMSCWMRPPSGAQASLNAPDRNGARVINSVRIENPG